MLPQAVNCFRHSSGTQILLQDQMTLGQSTAFGIHVHPTSDDSADWRRPDHCDGTFDANCDTARSYTNITDILNSFGKTDLLSYMQTYWKDYQGNDETFWEHEWGKHGTCVNTIDPSCYTDYEPTQEAVDFLQKTVDLFKTLPSYQVLILFFA